LELIDELGLKKGIVLTDNFVPQTEMPRYIASCDIGAIPLRDNARNRSKSSLTLLEYMACGLPTVTHDVGDTGWMLGQGGELAALDNPEDFGDKLSRLAKDAGRRADLGTKARARAEDLFTWGKTVDFLEAAYRHAIMAHKIKP
jgi:glycosyltransferase involved in cell wall biosynthesis